MSGTSAADSVLQGSGRAATPAAPPSTGNTGERTAPRFAGVFFPLTLYIAGATLVLIAVCFEPNMVYADATITKHKHFVARACEFKGRLYGEGDFRSLACRGGSCTTQTCHDGDWVIPPAKCAAGFGCPRFC
jgi:hypothetical protein